MFGFYCFYTLKRPTNNYLEIFIFFIFNRPGVAGAILKTTV